MRSHPCRSAHRCNQITCQTCVWRYCRSQTIRILTQSTGPLHTIILTIPNPSPDGFRAWRVEIRNRVDYVRRNSLAWRNFGFHGWLQTDGTVRGVAMLGRLGQGEVEEGLERWEATLGPEVEEEDLRVAIWRVVKPSTIYTHGPAPGRYWPVRCSIRPCRTKRQRNPEATDPMEYIGPMPWLM